MPFLPLPARQWKDLLGPNYLAQLRNDLYWLRSLAEVEHLPSTGEHNAWEVPRVEAQISTTTATPSTSDITAVTNPATGTFALTLAGGRFTTDMRITVAPVREDAKPYLATYRVLSATSVEIYNKKLTSTLGAAGNTWAAVNDAVNITIHSDPLALTSWGQQAPDPFVRGSGLIGGGSGLDSWSRYVKTMGDINKILLVGHTSAGEHNVRNVAKVCGRLTWNGSSYSYTEDLGVSSINRVSAGIIEVNHSSLSSAHAFCAADYQRNNSGSPNVPFIAIGKASGTTKTIMYLYAWDQTNGWWQVADGDFFFTIYGG